MRLIVGTYSGYAALIFSRLWTTCLGNLAFFRGELETTDVSRAENKMAVLFHETVTAKQR